MAKNNEWKAPVSELKLNGSVIIAEQVKDVIVENNIPALQKDNNLTVSCGRVRLLGFAGFTLFLVYMLMSQSGVYSFRNWSSFLSEEMREKLWRAIEIISNVGRCEWEQFSFENIPFGDKAGQARSLNGRWRKFVQDVFPNQWKEVVTLFKEAEKEASIKAQKGQQELMLSTISENLKAVQGLQIPDPEVKTALLAAIAGSLGYYKPTPFNSAVEAEIETEQPTETQTSEEDTGTFDD